MSIIVISVGTSLITNNCEVNRLKDHFGTVTSFLETSNPGDVRELSFSFENGKLSQVTPNNLYGGLYDFSREFFEKYMAEDHIKRNISLRKNGGDRLPAEISSLYFYYYGKEGNLREEFKGRLKGGSDSEFTERDRIILLSTDTADAVYCAKMLREMINRVLLFNSKCHVENNDVEVIKNLDVYDPSKWAYDPAEISGGIPMAQKGIERLINYFETRFTNHPAEGERVLIRTGGYKELSSLLMLLAIQYRFVSLYLFERSEKFVKLYIHNLPQQIDLVNIIRNTTYRGI